MSTIPTFPKFKLLDLQDRSFINNFSLDKGFYSDFNFISMWCYNTFDDAKICLLNNNLVSEFRDYETGEPILTFFGRNKPDETVKTLLTYRKSSDASPTLTLIPEFNLTDGTEQLINHYKITEDRDNFDYICSVSGISSLEGSKYRNFRQTVNSFKRAVPTYQVKRLELKDESIKAKMNEVVKKWELSQGANLAKSKYEHIAIERLFKYLTKFDDLLGFGLFIEDKLKAFIILEILDKENAIGHFWKADRSYSGIFRTLLHESCKILASNGILFINVEQDVGFSSLRQSKLLWVPVSMLKKYIITN